jgi:hypothetical protein
MVTPAVSFFASCTKNFSFYKASSKSEGLCRCIPPRRGRGGFHQSNGNAAINADTCKMLNEILKVQVSDTTDTDSSNADGFIKKS